MSLQCGTDHFKVVIWVSTIAWLDFGMTQIRKCLSLDGCQVVSGF